MLAPQIEFKTTASRPSDWVYYRQPPHRLRLKLNPDAQQTEFKTTACRRPIYSGVMGCTKGSSWRPQDHVGQFIKGPAISQQPDDTGRMKNIPVEYKYGWKTITGFLVYSPFWLFCIILRNTL